MKGSPQGRSLAVSQRTVSYRICNHSPKLVTSLP